MRCLFAKGKSCETVLSANVSAGSYILPIEQASLYFQSGDLCFISDADGFYAEFLGPVTSVSDSEIQCVMAVSQNREQGAACFKPSSFYWWPQKRTYPLQRLLDSGVEQRRSAGGILYLAKFRETSFSETVAFETLRKKEIGEFFSFVETVLLGGAEIFTFCDEEGSLFTAALLSSRITQKEASPERASIEMELAEIEKSRYV